jgi:opacity protein-like surface antigen
MFMPNLSAFIEYNYMNFSTNTATAIVPGGAGGCAAGCPFSLKLDTQTVLVGLNYRFR